jgi:DNA-binding CsgD family transcriptional regulator
MATHLTTVPFEGTNLSVIDHNDQRWLTADQIGIALGYSEEKARQGVNNLYKRHEDEFGAEDSCVIKMMTQGQGRDVRIFSATGCHLLSFFSNTPRAKQFRAWAKAVLAGQTAAPTSLEGMEQRLGKVEHNLGIMAENMAALVMISRQQAEKLDVTGRYIGLLEINQKGKVRVTRKKEAEALALRAQGMSMRDISAVLRISPTAVSQIINGKYPWANNEDDKGPLPTPTIEELIDNMVEHERERLPRLLDALKRTTSSQIKKARVRIASGGIVEGE